MPIVPESDRVGHGAPRGIPWADSDAWAAVGLIAVLSTRAYAAAPQNVALLLLSLLGLAQLLGVPLWSAAFALFAWLAPTREARRKLIIAVGIELVIAVCAAVHWLVP